MKRILLLTNLFVLLLAGFGQAIAQNAERSGRIVGKVTDKKTGEALIGVTVVIQGSTIGNVTDVEGRYTLQVAPGNYTIDFKYIGYATKSIADVAVKGAQPTTLNIIMDEPASKELKEVVIKGSYKQETINAIYTAQKNNAVVSDGISADLIKKSPDRNTGDVLKRVSGTSIADNKFVVVRGLAERYNTTLMNSTMLPSTEPDKKAFSFNIIPSSLIDNIIIYKTASPDLPGDFAGGAVKVNTKDLPTQQFTELSLGLGYHTMTTFKDFKASPPTGKLDWLGFLDNSKALPSAYASVKSSYTSLEQEERQAISQQFSSAYPNVKTSTSLPNLSLQFATGNTRQFKNNNRLGYLLAVNYGTSRRVTAGTRSEYDIDKNYMYQYETDNYSQTRNLGALLNIAYSYNKSKIAWKNFFNNDFNTSFLERGGWNYRGANDTMYIRSRSAETTQNGLFNSVLEGTHQVGRNKMIVDWNASYGRAYRNQPDQRIFTSYNLDRSAPYFVSIPSVNSPMPNTLGRIYSNLTENIFGGSVNLTVPFKLFNEAAKFKVGAMKNYRSRDFTVSALGYTDARYGQDITLDKGVDASTIFSPAGLQQYNLLLSVLDLSSTDYKGTSDLNAGYLMFDNRLATNLRVVWGARIENFQQKLISPNKADQKYTNTDVLPSINLTYNLTEKSNLRGSFFMAVNRPEFREIAAYTQYDYENDFIVRGDPNLQRSTSLNGDIRYEFYSGVGEIISASLFYKKFNNPIEQVNLGNKILSYQNAETATDYGAEIELRKNLGFLSGNSNVLKNMTFYVNAALIKGDITLQDRKVSSPMQGQSPYLLNGGLQYAAGEGFAFNVLYNKIGQRLKFRGENGGVDVFEKSRDILDFQVSKSVMKSRGEFKLNISDIFAQPISYYYKYDANASTVFDAKNDRIINKWKPGTSISVSFKYNFNKR
ncbi:TonB-dependent receptor [Chitinophaga skermanii]|uniref:TonB-dependent receptor n=1 Tax=Chitinophaga skermanii TaxID=331697 RepID=A0A327QQT0_9BACT|nr:TonB-dependent receptor [Chitinophaga skermanii]RAJ04147.1 TonB-dependent receptor [Chitinophaga skermanii]